MKKHVSLTIILLVLIAFMSCEKPSMETKKERKVFLEQVGTTAVAQLYADGFNNLSLKEKTLAYYLSQAVIAGERIDYDQSHKHSLEIKDMLEEIILHKDGIDQEVYQSILNYTKLFWIDHCQYNSRTKEKFVPSCSFDQFMEALERAQSNGANFFLEEGETLEDKLNRLEKTIFDLEFEPLVTAKTPPPGEDILTASANNFYENVTLSELENFEEKFPLNSKVVKEEGQIKELVWRAGNANTKPGLYAAELKAVIANLKKAIPYAGDQQKISLQHMIDYFETGDPESFRQANISWLKDDPTVDFIIGFIEVYKDSRGIKGEWEGLISHVNSETTQMMKNIAEEAQYFEDNAPWKEEYKKKDIQVPVANSIDVITAGGHAGPRIPAGINLPNEQEIREKHGTKSVLLDNVMSQAREVSGAKTSQEFLLTEEEKSLVQEYGGIARNAVVALHEVIGHGSGKTSPGLTKDPSEYLKEFFSTLEEARADLMACWNFLDPKLVELGVLPNQDAAKAGYISSVMEDLVMLRRIKKGSRIEDDHMRGDHLIQSYLEQKTGAIETVKIEGKTYRKIKDFDLMRQGIGELLAEIMRIKAEGDYEAAKELVNTYAIKIDPALRDEVVKRCQQIQYPDFVAFVVPELNLARDPNGEIIDVEISYPQDLVEQQLRWAGKKTK
ncbi:peptidase M49 [Acidobacteriota bacterium]